MTTCPLKHPECSVNDLQVIATRIREGEGRILQCPRCHLVMQDLDWSSEDINRYYNEVYQCTNSLVEGQALSAQEHFNERIQTIQPLFEHIRPLLCSSMKVLEVGCGAGELLSQVKPLVNKCVGVEINRAFTEFIRQELDIEAYAGEFTKIDFGNETFDLVICVDSLDHTPNPLEVLARMRDLLTESGTIWLSVPNLNEALNHFLPEPNLSRYREFFWHRAHFFYFTVETIATLLDVVDMDVQVITGHQYTLKNYFHWYFTGQPQQNYLGAATDVTLLSASDPFADEMNDLFVDIETRFQKILIRNQRGDSLLCHATLRK